MRDDPEEVLWPDEVGDGAQRDVAGRQEGRKPEFDNLGRARSAIFRVNMQGDPSEYIDLVPTVPAAGGPLVGLVPRQDGGTYQI